MENILRHFNSEDVLVYDLFSLFSCADFLKFALYLL